MFSLLAVLFAAGVGVQSLKKYPKTYFKFKFGDHFPFSILSGLFLVCFRVETQGFKKIVSDATKLDGVGPIDNRPLTD